MNGQLNTNTPSNYSWCIYEIPGHKVGMCMSSSYPHRPKVQVNKLLNKPKSSPIDNSAYKLIAELHDITRSEALDIEEEWQDKLGYLSDRDRKWMSAQSEERNAKVSASVSAARQGWVFSEETKAKMSAAHTGKVLSKEHVANMSAALKGRVPSDETKAKISAAHTGKVFSEETRAKMSASAKTRVASDEARANMSSAQKGKVASDEAKANMSAAQKKRYQKEKQRKEE